MSNAFLAAQRLSLYGRPSARRLRAHYPAPKIAASGELPPGTDRITRRIAYEQILSRYPTNPRKHLLTRAAALVLDDAVPADVRDRAGRLLFQTYNAVADAKKSPAAPHAIAQGILVGLSLAIDSEADTSDPPGRDAQSRGLLCRLSASRLDPQVSGRG